MFKVLKRKIHILFFTASLGGGGGEKHLLRVINHLDRSRFRLSLALARAGGHYEAALLDDVQVFHFKTGRIASSTLQIIRSIQPLRRLIQVEQPDILCSILSHANLVALAAASMLAKRPKIVVCVQTPLSIAYQYADYNIVDQLSLSLVPRLYPQADQIIAISRGVAHDLARLVPETLDQIEVIYNAGVDAEVLAGAAKSLPAEMLPPPGPLIVACGRLTTLKGFIYLLDALVQIRQVCPANLWIIGEGEQRQELESKIRQLNLGDCVRLLGFQPNPFQYMAAADVFVLPSLYEGFGNVIVEAMACGTAVVATDCPYGPAEIITHGLNGLLAPPANSEALAQAIIRVLTEPGLKKRLAKNGREHSWKFSADIIASAYGDLFSGVAGKRVETEKMIEGWL